MEAVARVATMSDEHRILTPEELRKADAEAVAAEATAKKSLAEARKIEAESIVAEVARDVAMYDRRKWLCGDEFHHTYYFTSHVNDKSVRGAMSALALWDRLEPKCNMSIIFSSPGGDIVEGFALFDYITMMRRSGHRIETGALGMAASMAGILLQAGDVRWMTKEAWLLIHEASFMTAGKIGEVEDTVSWVKRMGVRILDVFADRAAEKTGKTKKQVKDFVKKNWTRKDWWISSDEALTYGFVDEVR
jgi:ATP-dependent protease ClpP protease subunit